MHEDEARREPARTDADANQPTRPMRPFDEPPRRSRGPLLFGVVAATLQMGALLWLAKCR